MKANLWGVLALGLMAGSPNANAALIYTFQESPSFVTLSLTGSVNTTGLTGNGLSDSGTAQVNPSAGLINTGPQNVIQIRYEGVLSGPASYGTGSVFFPSLDPGSDAVSLLAASGDLYLPFGYSSGAPLDALMLFVGQTFLTMGLMAGSQYVYSLGAQDTVSILIGNAVSEVPESSSFALLGLGLAGLGLSRRRKAV